MKNQKYTVYTMIAVMMVLATLSCSFLGQATQNTGNVSADAATPVLKIVTATSEPALVEEEGPTVQPNPPTEPAEEGELLEEPAAMTPEAQLAADPPALEGPALDQECALESCIEDGFFYLERPVSAESRNTVDHSNRFGSYQKRTRDVHHGVDFLNSTGTPVYAAADGVVVVAGDDLKMPYALHTNTYGNLVILQHDLPGISEPVYTLYGHLSEIQVQKDEAITSGQQIGLVGMSGGVHGSTLHFEVRYGENLFSSVINPELWLSPLQDEDGQAQGALAGRVIDTQGNFLKVENIVLERLAGPGMPAIDQLYVKTYAEKRLLGISPIGETFGLGGLPAGEYQITFLLNGVHQRVVKIEPGKLTLVTFQF